MNEVTTPDIVVILRTQPNVWSVIQPKLSPLRLLLWNLILLSLPQPFNTIIANGPTCFSERYCNPSLMVSAKLSGSLDHVRNKTVFIRMHFEGISPCRAMLLQYSTSSAVLDCEPAARMINAITTTSGAQKFPPAASFKINLLSNKSDTVLLNRSFSFWNHFISFNCATPIPPYCLRQG